MLSVPGLCHDFGAQLTGSGGLVPPLYSGFCHTGPIIDSPLFLYLISFSASPVSSDLLYVSSDSRIYSEGTVALFTGTPALHVCWKQLHIEDNSTGTELLPHVKATSGSVHLTESQPTFCNTGTMKIAAFFGLKQKFSKVRTKGQV